MGVCVILVQCVCASLRLHNVSCSLHVTVTMSDFVCTDQTQSLSGSAACRGTDQKGCTKENDWSPLSGLLCFNGTRCVTRARRGFHTAFDPLNALFSSVCLIFLPVHSGSHTQSTEGGEKYHQRAWAAPGAQGHPIIPSCRTWHTLSIPNQASVLKTSAVGKRLQKKY